MDGECSFLGTDLDSDRVDIVKFESFAWWAHGVPCRVIDGCFDRWLD